MRVKRLTRGTGGTIRMTAHVTPGQTRGPAADVFPSSGPRVSRVGTRAAISAQCIVVPSSPSPRGALFNTHISYDMSWSWIFCLSFVPSPSNKSISIECPRVAMPMTFSQFFLDSNSGCSVAGPNIPAAAAVLTM